MTKSKIIGSALLLALATVNTSAATIDNDDEMAKIAFSVANILNHHDKPAAQPITQPVAQPVAQPTAQPAAKKITQDDFDKLVDELSKKVPAPQAAKPVENKSTPANLDKVVQADIDKIVAKINEKQAKNAAAHTENKVIIPKKDAKEEKQAKFDQLFEELRAKLKVAHEGKPAAAPATTISDKYDQIVAKVMNKNTKPVETAPKKVLSTFEQEREQLFHELREKLTRAHSQAAYVPKTAQVSFPKPVEKKAEEKTSVACLLSHAEATSTIRKIADTTDKTFTIQNVRNVRELLEELAGKVQKINNNCEAKYKVNFTHADINSTCQKDFTMTATLAKIFKNTHPGTIQRVMTTSTEMMVIREQMKKNC